MYEVILSNIAKKNLDKIHHKDYLRVRKAILEFEGTPRPIGCKKLTARGGYRVRVGRYRILYEVDDAEKKVMIYSVVHRKDAYR